MDSANYTILAPDKIDLKQKTFTMCMTVGEFAVLGSTVVVFVVKVGMEEVGHCAAGLAQEQIRPYALNGEGVWEPSGPWGTWQPGSPSAVFNFAPPNINDTKQFGETRQAWDAYEINDVMSRYDQRVRLIYSNCQNEQQILQGSTYELSIVKTADDKAEVRLE